LEAASRDDAGRWPAVETAPWGPPAAKHACAGGLGAEPAEEGAGGPEMAEDATRAGEQPSGQAMGQTRRLVVSEYLTLDGLMEEPGKWSFQFWTEEAAKFKYDELFASDALLLGRITYDGFAKAWPKMEGTGNFGERMNGMRKYVVSTTLETPEWNNSQVIRENVAEEIAALKRQPGMDILVAGSGQLLRTLMAHDLVDEYRLMLYPIVLGAGKRLFQDGIDTTALRHTRTQALGSGVLALYYEPIRQQQAATEAGASETVG
jgi:dihydrofolate reductase